jgi:hypothetical protein
MSVRNDELEKSARCNPSWQSAEHKDAYWQGFDDARKGAPLTPPEGLLRAEYLAGWNHRSEDDAEREAASQGSW